MEIDLARLIEKLECRHVLGRVGLAGENVLNGFLIVRDADGNLLEGSCGPGGPRQLAASRCSEERGVRLRCQFIVVRVDGTYDATGTDRSPFARNASTAGAVRGFANRNP